MPQAADSILVDEVSVVNEPRAAESGSPQPCRLSDRQRRQRIGWLIVLAAVYAISFVVPRSSLPHVPLCWLHALTGWDCPACGLTRAFTEIGHGNFAGATQLNLLAIPLFAIGIGLLAVLVHELYASRSWLSPWIGRHKTALLLLLACGVMLRYVPIIWGL